MTLPFRGPLVRVKRNRLVLALTALPLILPIALHYGVGGAPGARSVVGVAFMEALALHLVLALLAWRKNPWPHRETVDVEADAVALRVDGEEIPREALSEGFVVPSGGETKIVLARRGIGSGVELVAKSVKEARRVLLALGFDASQTVARFRTLSRAFADLRYVFVPFALAPCLGIAASIARGHGPSSPWPLVVLIGLLAMFAVVMLVPTRVTVGADGVELRWFGKRRFVRHRDIVNATQYVAGLGNSRYTGVSLTLESGEEVRIPIGQARSVEDRTRMVLERIQEAAAEGKREHLELDPALLARGDRDVGDWMRALRSLGAGANATMRTAPIEAERLWRIVEDPAGPPLARAAAAVALTSDPAADSRRRLRAAAEATAAPRLRIAIDAAASHDQEALQEALAELESEEATDKAKAPG
jgi:hypothetical protein